MQFADHDADSTMNAMTSGNYAGVHADVLAAATAIANDARRRHERRKTLRAIPRIAAFAIGIVVYGATLVTLATAPTGSSFSSDAFNVPFMP